MALDVGTVLHGSGRTHDNTATLLSMQGTLPTREFEAIAAWLSTFYGYQQTWLLDRSRFSLLLKCRQIGASHTYAAAAVLWGIWGEQTSIVSIGEREATDVVHKASLHAHALHSLGSEWAKPYVTKKGVYLASKGSVTALPSSSAGRGKSGNVLLDEAAYYQNAKEVWDGASASALHGYRLRVMSTPNGTGNLFHQLCTDDKSSAGYRKHVVTLDDAIADGMNVDVNECWKLALGDPRLFNQLFRCKFLDGDTQYIPSSLVTRAIVDDTYCYEGETYAGLDIGRTADITALVVVKKDADGVCWEQHVYECKRTSQEALDGIVEQAFREHRLRRLCVDATGLGAFPAEALQKKYGRFKVEPVVFTQGSKEDLATTLYQVLADEKLRLARSSQALRDDMMSLRRIVTSAGNVRYDAPHTDKGHADRAWALALALHACSRGGKAKFEVAGDYAA